MSDVLLALSNIVKDILGVESFSRVIVSGCSRAVFGAVTLVSNVLLSSADFGDDFLVESCHFVVI